MFFFVVSSSVSLGSSDENEIVSLLLPSKISDFNSNDVADNFVDVVVLDAFDVADNDFVSSLSSSSNDFVEVFSDFDLVDFDSEADILFSEPVSFLL